MFNLQKAVRKTCTQCFFFLLEIVQTPAGPQVHINADRTVVTLPSQRIDSMSTGNYEYQQIPELSLLVSEKKNCKFISFVAESLSSSSCFS